MLQENVSITEVTDHSVMVTNEYGEALYVPRYLVTGEPQEGLDAVLIKGFERYRIMVINPVHDSRWDREDPDQSGVVLMPGVVQVKSAQR
jgi:hypothetical protein